MSTGTSGASIGRNTFWNFLGVAAPVPAALIAIPMLVHGLGEERFGLLTIAWAVMGYFSVFDFGLSRATTRSLAQILHAQDSHAAQRVFWSSTAAHGALGLLGGLILFAAAPSLENILAVAPSLHDETVTVFRVLALSVPVILLTSVARGLLEAVHRFDLVNVVKLPASLVTYLGPVGALAFTDRLPPIVLVILTARIAVLLTYAIQCVMVMPSIRKFQRPRLLDVGALARVGGWLTVGTILTPTLVTIDRFVIGSVVSVAAVAAYAAPYEVVTKLWMFSGSLLGVLFPQFAILSENRPALQNLYWRALGWLFACTTPFALLIVAFAPEFFTLWLGPEIAREGISVAQWLTVGVLINVVAQVPYTALQATDHPDIAGKLQLLQLPFYIVGAWLAAVQFGVVGVAIAWTIRAAVDAVLMFAAVRSRLEISLASRQVAQVVAHLSTTTALMIWCWIVVPHLAGTLAVKIPLVCVAVGGFAWLALRGADVGGIRAALMLKMDV
ncbi:MAG TPA: flippase [Vicinamibacterales bacterium]